MLLLFIGIIIEIPDDYENKGNKGSIPHGIPILLCIWSTNKKQLLLRALDDGVGIWNSLITLFFIICHLLSFINDLYCPFILVRAKTMTKSQEVF